MRKCFWCMNKANSFWVNWRQFCSEKCANDWIDGLKKKCKEKVSISEGKK